MGRGIVKFRRNRCHFTGIQEATQRQNNEHKSNACVPGTTLRGLCSLFHANLITMLISWVNKVKLR